MAPRSLYELAKIAAIRNIDLLTDIGELPYDFMRPVLLKIENPDQLRQLEITCPQLLGHDGEIWLKLIKKVPGWDKKPHEPKNPESWWKVYRKLKKEADQDTRDAEEMFKEKMAVQMAKRDAHTITAPVMMIPEKSQKRKAGPITFTRTADKSSLRFTGGSKTKNVIEKARRETAEAKLRRQGALTTPTHLLPSSQVRRAPQNMIDNRRLEASRPVALKPLQLSTVAKPRPKQPASVGALAEREARLKAMQSSKLGTPIGARVSLAPGTNYKVPPIRRLGTPLSRSTSPIVGPSSPPHKKRKREVDVFMKPRKR